MPLRLALAKALVATAAIGAVVGLPAGWMLGEFATSGLSPFYASDNAAPPPGSYLAADNGGSDRLALGDTGSELNERLIYRDPPTQDASYWAAPR